MEMIGEGAAQGLIFAGGEGGGDGAGVSGILHGVKAIDAGRKESASFGCGDFEIGDEKDEVQLRGDGEHLALESRGQR